jgi:hypothetical protein
MEKDVSIIWEWWRQKKNQSSEVVKHEELTLEIETNPYIIPIHYKETENATQVERGSVIVDHSIYDGGSNE